MKKKYLHYKQNKDVRLLRNIQARREQRKILKVPKNNRKVKVEFHLQRKYFLNRAKLEKIKDRNHPQWGGSWIPATYVACIPSSQCQRQPSPHHCIHLRNDPVNGRFLFFCILPSSTSQTCKFLQKMLGCISG